MAPASADEHEVQGPSPPGFHTLCGFGAEAEVQLVPSFAPPFCNVFCEAAGGDSLGDAAPEVPVVSASTPIADHKRTAHTDNEKETLPPRSQRRGMISSIPPEPLAITPRRRRSYGDADSEVESSFGAGRRSSASSIATSLHASASASTADCVTPRATCSVTETSTPRASSVRCSSVRCSEGTSGSKGDVRLCVRLRPGPQQVTVASVESGGVVRLRPAAWARNDIVDSTYQCDHAFGQEADQEQVFAQAVAPICESVLRGYNGAVIAYGQTGSGKTHTMVGEQHGRLRGIAPRAVSALFNALHKCRSWDVNVSVLEIYNEKARDLLAFSVAAVVAVHETHVEGQGASFRCPDAIQRRVKTPDEALAALFEGMQRRETAKTDMNHSSSRSHLVFTIDISQTDTEVGATLRSRFHLVDLAGSERLKRSLASAEDVRSSSSRRSPRGNAPRSSQELRKEACEINKSLSQLALVIQRLTTTGSAYVPYRDSVLTRLLAESFGGSSKTCLIITCSATADNREETRCSLEFGKRAKQVRNRAEINVEVASDVSEVVKAYIAKEVGKVQRERDAMMAERDAIYLEKEALKEHHAKAQSSMDDIVVTMQKLQEEKEELHKMLSDVSDAMIHNKDASQSEIKILVAERDVMRQAVEEGSREKEHLEQTLQVLEKELREVKHKLKSEVSSKRALEEQHRTRIAALAEEQSVLQRLNKEASEDVARLHQEKAEDITKRETEMRDIYQKWRGDVDRLEQEKSSLISKLEADNAENLQRLQTSLQDSLRLQEEATLATQKVHDQKVVLMNRWQEDAQKAREENAVLIVALEDQKVDLFRRWQEDVARVRDTHAEVVACLEQGKSAMRKKWQGAVQEVRQLQAELSDLEGKYEEAQRTSASALEAEREAFRRQCREESVKMLADQAAETSKAVQERNAHDRSRDDDIFRHEQEMMAALAKLEAEKEVLQKQLQETTVASARQAQERATLCSEMLGDQAAAGQTWQADFVEQASRLQQHVETTAFEISSSLASSERRRQDFDTSLQRIERELVALNTQSCADISFDMCSPNSHQLSPQIAKEESNVGRFRSCELESSPNDTRRARPFVSESPSTAVPATVTSNTSLGTHEESTTDVDAGRSSPSCNSSCDAEESFPRFGSWPDESQDVERHVNGAIPRPSFLGRGRSDGGLESSPSKMSPKKLSPFMETSPSKLSSFVSSVRSSSHPGKNGS